MPSVQTYIREEDFERYLKIKEKIGWAEFIHDCLSDDKEEPEEKDEEFNYLDDLVYDPVSNMVYNKETQEPEQVTPEQLKQLKENK